ncbi:MAG TPA: hypothetical protein VK550_14295 [Polyangiaceae bacterium]|nr:hypothetical protein [Polyangiaceae bacterium]
MASENETVRGGSLSAGGDVLSYPPAKMSWGAIFGGAVAALGVWMMLYALGLALGLSSLDPHDPSTLKSSGAFTGIWGLITPLAALFVGGMVAGRGAGIVTKMGGAIHGLVVWGLTTVAGVWLLVNIVTAMVGGVAAVGKTAVQAGTGVAMGAAQNSDQVGRVAGGFGLDVDDALRPINQRLHAEGKPTVNADQLRAAASNVVQQGWAQGRVDRSLLISGITQNTALSRADAEQIATGIETQFSTARANIGDKLSGAAQSVQTGALQAAETTGKAFWGIFGALFLGLASSIAGATAGVSKRQRIWAERPAPPRDLTPLST